jgi:hypothetical protein
VFGRAVFQQNENPVFLVKHIDVFNNISESININLKDYVEFEVIMEVTGTDVIFWYKFIDVSKEPTTSH